jgi:hypothetical protein
MDEERPGARGLTWSWECLRRSRKACCYWSTTDRQTPQAEREDFTQHEAPGSDLI